jgi:hypothetical protein
MTIRRQSLFVLVGIGFAITTAHADVFYNTSSGTECIQMQDITPDIYYNLDGAYSGGSS